jgi:3-carboxy-cis,cis-muconate cycloisomerase
MAHLLAPFDLYGPLFASDAMRTIVADVARLQRMLDVEAALARAEARVGVIPAQAVAPIEAACRADRYDPVALAQAAVSAGNLAIPLVKALTAEVGLTNAEAARYVHWGATSQDIIDTAQMLELRAAIDSLMQDAARGAAEFAGQAERHRATPLAGRTWLQHAVPIPLGLKLAGYAAALQRSHARLERLRREAIVLQFGGAAGTLAALGDAGLAVAERLGAEIGLAVPDAPWHSHRDRVADVAAGLAILAGSCGKIARDVSLLMQTEVAEAFEPAAPGRGGSSTMPQKRNPVGSSVALAAATIAPQLTATILAAQVGEHERSTGSWQAEWPIMPALLLVVSGGLRSIVEIAEAIEIDAERMLANLDATEGQIMAEAVMIKLAEKLGRSQAHHLLQQLSKQAASEHRHLQEVLASHPEVTNHFSADEMARLFDPLAYQGVAQAFIDRLIVGSRGQ